jgi:hypothetical protein
MADMQMPGKPPMPPGGGGMPPGEGEDKFEKNLSLFNPADAALMKSRGDIQPNMTIRDFFQKQGLNVDGPVMQLVDFAKRQMKSASPLGKAQEIGGGAPPGGEMPQGMPPGMPGGGGPPGGSPGLAGLLKQGGGGMPPMG